MVNLSTPEMKYYMLSYFRFQRQYPIAATEVGVFGNYVADVLASDYKEFVEVEVKISESDFVSDFSHKDAKHTAYLDLTIHKTATLGDTERKQIPNRFYYAVPYGMERFALQYIKDTPYGLIYVNPKDPKLSLNGFVKIVKHGAPINRLYPEKLERKAIMRMSSELVNMYELMLDI